VHMGFLKHMLDIPASKASAAVVSVINTLLWDTYDEITRQTFLTAVDIAT